MHPVKIQVHNQKELFLKWNDKSESVISLDDLRKLCPCAICVSEREAQSNSYIPLYHSDQIKILKIIPVGKYAIEITWADGHNTGIYEFSFLQKLAQKAFDKV